MSITLKTYLKLAKLESPKKSKKSKKILFLPLLSFLGRGFKMKIGKALKYLSNDA